MLKITSVDDLLKFPFETLTVRTSHDGTVVHVNLNRPSKRNALSTQSLSELESFATSVNHTHSVQVVVFRGNGKSFCAGADLSDPPEREAFMTTTPLRRRRWVAQRGHRCMAAIRCIDAMTVAVVHGHAIGGGFGLMLSCDFRVVENNAILSVPEIQLGLPLAWGLTAALAAEIGPARAKQLIALGEAVTPTMAAQIGLIQYHCVAPDLDTTVAQLIDSLATKDAHALHMIKSQFRAIGASGRQGDVTESDGDLLVLHPPVRLMSRL